MNRFGTGMGSMYGSSGYGSMLGGGMYGRGMMGGGLGGMGMGMGGMGGLPQGQPGGFRQDYHTVFAGLKNLLQIAYSGLGLFSFGKLFGTMAWNLVKNIAKKFLKGAKLIYGLIFLNKVSAKIINGAVQRARSVSADSAAGIFVKALFAVAIACIVAVGFLQASHSLDEDEDRIRRQASSRLRELEVTNQRLE